PRDVPPREHAQKSLDVVVAARPLEIGGRELADEVALAVERRKREAQVRDAPAAVGVRVAEEQLPVLRLHARRRLDGERRDDLRLAARGQAVVAGRVLEDRALHVLVAALRVAALTFVARWRARHLGDRLAQVLRLQPEALLYSAEVLRLHRGVSVRDGVEDGLQPVLELARWRLGGHGL